MISICYLVIYDFDVGINIGTLIVARNVAPSGPNYATLLSILLHDAHCNSLPPNPAHILTLFILFRIFLSSSMYNTNAKAHPHPPFLLES